MILFWVYFLVSFQIFPQSLGHSKFTRTYFNSSCFKASRWQSNGIQKAITSWLESVESLSKPLKKHPKARALFSDDRYNVFFLSEDPTGHGVSWKKTGNEPHDGFLHGRLDKLSQFTGNDIAFIYSDFSTALFGAFVNGSMISAKQARVSGFRNTYIDQSTISNSGEGLFARRKIYQGQIVAVYAGFMVSRQKYGRGSCNTSVEATTEHKKYLLSFKSSASISINIPSGLSQVWQYRASLGHKINHSFTPNAKYKNCWNPRFGLTRCVVALTNIRRGEEVFCNYGYALDLAPDWYMNLWRTSLSLERQQHEMFDIEKKI